MVATQTPLQPGSRAPDFTLTDQNGRRVRLSDLTAGANVVLVFYPFAFSGICTGELDGIRDNLGEYVADDLHLLTISCDPTYALRGWADAKGYFFPLLSDFWPHGAVTRDYGVFDESGGMPVRGTFLIDATGTIRWTLINPPSVGRDFSGLQEALRELRA